MPVTQQTFETMDYGVEAPRVLTAAEIRQFNRDGYVFVKDAFSAERALAIQDRIWEIMREKRGILREDPATWTDYWHGLSQIKKCRFFNDLQAEKLHAVFDDLLGEGGWQLGSNYGGFLLGAPDPDAQDGPYLLPRGQWHWDARPRHDRPAGVWCFTVYGELPPRAGGTLLVSGSHRLVGRYYGEMDAEVFARGLAWQKKRCTGRFEWYARLQEKSLAGDAAETERWINEGETCEGVDLRVVQVHGEPGDAVVAHPWIVHARPNLYGTQPRFLRVGAVHRVLPD